jgi:hypothetical protein
MHRMIDKVADGVANGITGFVGTAAGAIKGLGKSVMTGLDKPFNEITGKEGPHRILDRAADGIVDAGVNFVDNGVVGTARTAGKGIMRALDQPLEQIKGMGKFEMPWKKR